MEVSIGLRQNARELRIQVDGSAEDVRKQVEDALNVGGKVVWLTDTDGRQVGVPLDSLAFVEIGSDKASKQVGFSVSVTK